METISDSSDGYNYSQESSDNAQKLHDRAEILRNCLTSVTQGQSKDHIIYATADEAVA